MSVQLLRAHRGQAFLPAALLVSAITGAGVAVSPTTTLLGWGAVAGMAITLLLPIRALLFLLALLTFTGFRPFPPVLGFHIQAQYFLLLPLLLRASLLPRPWGAAGQDRWRRFLQIASVVVAVSLLSLGQDVLGGGPQLTVLIGDYVAWVMAFVFLFALAGIAGEEGPDFARALYRILVDVIGAFAIFTLLSSPTQAATGQVSDATRLSLADLGPNETGLIVAAGILLVLAPTVLRKALWRDLVWLPFLCLLLIRTGSRESLAALAFGLLVLLIHARGRRSIAWYIYVAMGVVTAGLFLAIFAQAIVPRQLNRTVRFAELTPYLTILGMHVPPPLAERIYIQVTAIQQYLQHPLFGGGFFQGLKIVEGKNAPQWWGPPLFEGVAHDSFITVAAQQGLLGLIAFVGLIVTALRTSRAAVSRALASGSDQDIAVGVRCALLMLVFGAFNIDALYTEFKILTLFFWLVITAVLLLPPDASPRSAPQAELSLMAPPGQLRPVEAETTGTGRQSHRP